MPHFGSGGGAGTTNGSPTELIRLWRSRLSTSDIGAAADASQRHHRRSCPPTPLEGVLSQQPKMSETQDLSSVVERRGCDDTNVALTRQKSEIDEEREDSEQRDAPETAKSECASTPRCDEPRKNFGGAVPDAERSQPASATASQQQPPPTQRQQQQQQTQQSRAGECNLLPVLVERLRSALELSCSSQSSEDPLPLEDSGVDSEEDLRLWSSSLGGASTSLVEPEPRDIRQEHRQEHRQLDLKFLEDILLADIHTALARLQDTLSRVDIKTLTRYNASLDPSNKLYLLRLISSLLAKLKVPEEAIAKPLESENRSHSVPRRRKNERHTVSVTAEEIARARRCLEQDSSESSAKFSFEKGNEVGRAEPADPKEQTLLAKPNVEIPMTFDKAALNDKCMKDAINQQQSLQSKTSRDLQRVPLPEVRFCKDDSALHEYQDRNTTSYYQQHSTAASKANKFTAKKWKIKRANTIDIPNYLKLKSDSPDHLQNGCFALRRPIEVGDRIVNGHHRVVPSFEPKTENDRKFLALINKNTDSSANNSSNPFKSFNYRQTASVADRNWSNRFSNIKTNFESRENEEPRRKSSILDVKKKFESRDSSSEREALPIAPAKVTPHQKSNGFTHAPTSPFQKIEKSTAMPVSHYTKTGYVPQKNSTLQAKLKLFDQDSSKSAALNNAVNNAEPQTRSKNNFIKPLENSFPTPHPTNKRAQEGKLPLQEDHAEDGHLNYYSFCKQFAPFANGKTNASENKSNINLAKNKFLVNLNKDSTKVETSETAQQELKNPFAKLDADSNVYDSSKQYCYHKAHDKHDPEPYGEVERKPEFQYSHLAGNVQVQSQEALQTRHELQLANTSLDLSREQPTPQPRRLLNNVVSQTSSQNPSVLSPPVHTQESKQQPSLNVQPANYANCQRVQPGNYSNYQRVHPACNQAAQHYFQPNNIVEGENYHQATKEASHGVISQKLYNEFSKLPDKAVYPSISIPCEEPGAGEQMLYEENRNSADPIEENIENQDISSDGIVTRYTCAIATVSSAADAPEAPVAARRSVAERKSLADVSLEEIQRHNMLQQSLIRRIQGERQLPGNPQGLCANLPGRACALERINMFEGKRLKNQEAPALKVPALPAKNQRASPVDSSDEYLMSCASRPSRNIVLSKSESWHQLAMARAAGSLQPPQALSGMQLKPPKPKSPSSLRLSKQFEASPASENLRKMEEKIQRYFQSSSGGSQPGEPKQSLPSARRESKSKRNLQSKKSVNSLMRSHTMPHLYDERLFDDNVDVDTAFESIFKEATRTDNRH